MAAKTKRGTKGTNGASKSVRTSVTLPREVYETLGQLAKSKRVTVAWVIRDAAEKYVGNEWPLFRQGAA
jgi:predicted DNA-binding ribbon-helix-helix protein